MVDHNKAMPCFFHPDLKLLAGSINHELLIKLQFLKAENEILRNRLPKRIRVTMVERTRLLKFRKPLGQRSRV